MVGDFLSGISPYDPKDYIRHAVEVGNGAWLPMHFHASKAGLDRNGLANFIKTMKASAKRKEAYVDRALGKSEPYQKAGGEAVVWLDEIKAGAIPGIKAVKDATNVARAKTGLEEKPALPLEDIIISLKIWWEIIEEKKPSWLGIVRRSIARADELFFEDVQDES